MSDLIIRQEVITEIGRWLGYLDEDMINRIRIGINRLPSAEPEIIHCRDCEFGEVDNPCFPDQYFCRHHGCDWNMGDHYCGYAERREDA